MDYREQLQPGVGFLHLQRTLHPGERVPPLPSLLAQLSALQSGGGPSGATTEGEPMAVESVADEADEADELDE